MAKPGAAVIFFQGSTAAPITPIQTFIKAGGAIIDDGGNTITIAEPLRHDATLGSTQDGGLVKTNFGKLTLTATNTYTGDTLVTAGTLALAANGSFSNSLTINISADAVLDASGRADGRLTVAASQTLAGNGAVKGNVTIAAGCGPRARFAARGCLIAGGGDGGDDDTNQTPDVDVIGTLTFSNNVTLSGGSLTVMDLNQSPATNDMVQVASALTYGGTLSLNINDTFDATDSFKLFAAGSYSGVFTNIVPATPGVGLAWNTNTLATDGTLRIVAVAPPAPPVIAGVILTGGNMIVSGSNGLAGSNFYVLTSTNLSLSLSNWNRAATGAFDINGNFRFTNDSGVLPQQYYILQLP